MRSSALFGRPPRTWPASEQRKQAAVTNPLKLENGKAKETEEGQRDFVRRMWLTGWGLVSGEWDEQQRKVKETL